MLSAIANKHILFLNWRDIGHPDAGGSEAYCLATATRFARAGAHMTLFTARHSGAMAQEVRDGVRVVRAGGRLSVYPAAATFLRRHRNEFDAVVDFQNGIPFFAPVFARTAAVVCVIHHVHQEQFGLHFRPSIARVGRFLERDASRVVYGFRPVVVVSPSTRRDVRLSLGLRGPIHIVPNGIDRLPVSAVERSASPSIGVVTRLVAHKRLDLLIDAVPGLLARWPALSVDIAGTGKDLPQLAERVRTLGLEGVVAFHGYVTEERKAELLQRSWLTVAPSLNEGWGLTVLEANSVGRPAVTYDVPGLRDSVLDGVTGWLVPEGRSLEEGIARGLDKLTAESDRLAYEQRCKVWARAFDWDTTADRLAAVVSAEIDRSSFPRQHRGTSDLAVVIEGRHRHLDGARATLVASRLRRTDRVTLGGDQVHLLLHGCDEEEAIRAGERAGVDVARVALATHHELLASRQFDPEPGVAIDGQS